LPETRIDKAMIASTLRDLSVKSGDAMALHSNVPSLGRILIKIQKAGGHQALEQAVNDVIDAFLETLGPDGLLMVPTFSYCYVGNKAIYHPDKTASKVGLLTNTFRQRPDAHRSLHPTHSVAAIGSKAAEIIRDHENKTPLGIDSPFHRLAKAGGWICNLGTNCKTLSLLHVAEVIAQAPYINFFACECLGWRPTALIERQDGTAEEMLLTENPGCSENFGKFDDLMIQAGITRTATIYKSRVVLFRANEALELAVDQLKKDPFFFLCPRGRCPLCDSRYNAWQSA